MNNKSPWTVCLKWGLIFGVAAVAFEVVRMMARNLEMGNQAAGGLALIIIYVLLLYVGLKEFKERYPARLSFGKAFLACIIISTIGCFILFGYEVLHYTKIEPDGMEKRYQTSLANYRNTIDRDTVTTAELNCYFDTLSAAMKSGEEQIIASQDTAVSDAMRVEIQKGTELLQKYYKASLLNDYQKRNVQTADTLWNLAHFSQTARRSLMKTLELYLNQNPNAASTPYVQQIVQGSENAMREYSIANNRFELKKADIPHYTNPISYAGINAFFSWIYALLVGIFVALYHYRSKHAIDDVPVEEGAPVENEMPDDENPVNESENQEIKE
ncbi:MAG: DUF4199 domain-containing protein [Bacteroidales bacterium]|nr:DUF4199 domain-containing protein [Bacteroidales bacterium]